MKIALVGTGLIGGSLGLALRHTEFASQVVGWDSRRDALDDALRVGAIGTIAKDAREAVHGAEIVVVAVPVAQCEAVFAAIDGALDARACVTDVGSTKRDVCAAAARALSQPRRFVGAHPIAGKERSGVGAASGSLFDGRTCWLTPEESTDPDARARIEQMWRAVGAEIVTASAVEHDAVMALTSHLPHAMAFALGATLESASPDLALLGRGGQGVADATRIAASDAELWADVLVANRDHLAPALRKLAEEIEGIRVAIDGQDKRAVKAIITRAHRGRARIVGEG